jgi:hypothetical protein
MLAAWARDPGTDFESALAGEGWDEHLLSMEALAAALKAGDPELRAVEAVVE